MALTKLERRKRIKMRIRKVVTGTADRPRMSVFRSNKQIYVQLVDDISGNTLLSFNSLSGEVAGSKGNKSEIASLVGKVLAQKALETGITEVVFDRNGYLYHGRVKKLAEAAREGGLKI